MKKNLVKQNVDQLTPTKICKWARESKEDGERNKTCRFCARVTSAGSRYHLRILYSRRQGEREISGLILAEYYCETGFPLAERKMELIIRTCLVNSRKYLFSRRSTNISEIRS